MIARRRLPAGWRPVLLMLAGAPCLGATAAVAGGLGVPPESQASDSATMRLLLLRQVDFWLLHGQPERAAYALNRLLRLNPSNIEAARLLATLRSEEGPDADARMLAPSPILQVQDDTAESPLPPPSEPADPLAPDTPSALPEPAPAEATAPLRSPARPLSRINERDLLTANQALLRRDPSDLAARQQAFDAALRLGDRSAATALASDALRLDADDPRAWLMAADLDHANGITAREQQERQTARSLRTRQVADIAEDRMPTAETADIDRAAPSEPLALADAAAAQPDGLAPPTPHAVLADPLASEIDRRIDQVTNDLATKVYIGPYLLYRSGTAGLNQLVEVAPKMEASFSPGGAGRLTVDAIPTFLDAGRLSSGQQAQFGTGALGAGSPSNQTATGVGLDAAYAYGWFKADVGVTPLGFKRQNVIGGVELSPRLADTVTLHIIGERRPVTETLLSYAGATDPRTGATWGGVIQDRAYARLDLAVGPGELHAGGGYDTLTGDNVRFNDEYETGVGGSYPVWRTAGGELRVGADVSYLSFARNLNQFTFGQGGYFSPRSYVAGVIPVRYDETDDQLKWSVGGQIGYQHYRQSLSPYFPDDAALQSQLEALVAKGTATTAYFNSSSSSNLVGGGSGSVEYNITPAWVFGAQASFQDAEDYSDTEVTVFTRYTLGGNSE